jgi:hypothetical protein
MSKRRVELIGAGGDEEEDLKALTKKTLEALLEVVATSNRLNKTLEERAIVQKQESQDLHYILSDIRNKLTCLIVETPAPEPGRALRK